MQPTNYCQAFGFDFDLVKEDDMELRPAVAWFAEQMETKLREKDVEWPNGWANDELTWLFARLVEEMGELGIALENRGKPDSSYGHITSEAADVANIAMMIADKFNANYGK